METANCLEPVYFTISYLLYVFMHDFFNKKSCLFGFANTQVWAKNYKHTAYYSYCTGLEQSVVFSTVVISINTPNPKCRLYWCLIEFIDWR